MTLGEVGQVLQAVEQDDKLHWMRASQQMALLYNINRGKAQSLNWQDFNPYALDDKPAPAPAKITPAHADLFRNMQNKMNHGPKSIS